MFSYFSSKPDKHLDDCGIGKKVDRVGYLRQLSDEALDCKLRGRAYIVRRIYEVDEMDKIRAQSHEETGDKRGLDSLNWHFHVSPRMD